MTGTASPAAALPKAAIAPGALDVPVETRTYEGAGGRPLRYQVVPAAATRHHLLYVHGIESHGGWFLPAATRLREHGVTTWLFDRRGSGLNRGDAPGDAESAAVLLEDLRRARACVDGGAPVHLAGLSWGGKLATAGALARPQDWASLVLIAPGLCPRVALPLRHSLAVALSLAVGGRRRVDVPLRPEMFTVDPRMLAFLRDDPLRVRQVTARFLAATLRLDRLVRARRAALAMPVLLALAGDDTIVDNTAVQRLVERLAPGRVRTTCQQGAAHAIQLHGVDRLVADIAGFLEGQPW